MSPVYVNNNREACVWSERGVISAESFYHPLRRVWHGQDGAETSVMHGEWTTSQRSDCTFQHRRQLVHVIRSVAHTDGTLHPPPRGAPHRHTTASPYAKPPTREPYYASTRSFIFRSAEGRKLSWR